MSLRIRGQEATIQVLVDGEPQPGSWTKVKNFQVSHRHDLIEEEYLGEAATDLDEMYNGADFSFEVDIEDATVIDFLSNIIDRSVNGAAHPVITVNVTYTFRNGNLPRIVSYQECFLKVSSDDISGRKEYVSASFEGKAKRRKVLSLS